jgi:CDGSH-type Zn-finger protein
MDIVNKKIRIKIKKNVKYSICSCGYSKKLPYCDNQHRLYNQENNTDYKSVKIYPDNDTSIQLSCSKWKSENEE